jgi:hypothetical protein
MRPLYSPGKEVDVEFLVFVERYATDLLKWDILSFFGSQPDFCGQSTEIAAQIGRSSQIIRPELANLALLGILKQQPSAAGAFQYQLTSEPKLRGCTVKLASTQLTAA